MEKVLTKREKLQLCLLGLCRSFIYICWYSFAIVIAYFILNRISDHRLEFLLLFLIVIYTIRNILKSLHRKYANKLYHNYKHKIEMKYFKKIKDIDNRELATMDLEDLGNTLILYSYTKAKVISDVIEFIIPFILGIFTFMAGAISVNYILSLIAIISFIILLIIRHILLLKNDDTPVSNYNDLLCDFVKKALTIKKLKISSFAESYLDANEDNDAIVLKNNDASYDVLFSAGISIVFAIILIATYFIIDGGFNIIAYLLFFIIIFIKLQDLLYEVNPSIINMMKVSNLKKRLNTFYEKSINYKYVKVWKKINIKDGVVKYNDISIKIPNFELLKGDQVSIIGKSGEGKSTILNILSGINTLDEGEFTIDNQETEDIIEAVYISRSVSLFNISLRDNLCLGHKKSDEELISLLYEAGLKEWFLSLRDGLDTIMDERYNLSIKDEIGRLNIIRGIILDKQLYFLDEPIAEEDMDIEKTIVAMIKKYFKKKTFIVITDRPILRTICKKHYFMKKNTLLDKEPLL